MNSQIQQDLQKVFKSFDTDNNGTIQLHQLIKVAQALGQKIQQTDAKKIIKKLDINKDGKISLQEFKYWWLNGFKGKLGRLVYLKSKSAKIGKNIMKFLQLKKINTDTSTSGNDYKNSFKCSLKLGQQKPNGISIKLQFDHKGPKSQQKIQSLQKQINIKRQNLNIFLVLQSDKSTKKQQILNFFIQLKSQFELNQIQSLQDNPYFSITTTDYKDNKILLKIQIKQDLINIIQGQLQTATKVYDNLVGQDKNIGINLLFKTNFTIDQLMKQKNIIQNVLKGIIFQLDVQMSRKILAKIRQSYQNQIKEDNNKQDAVFVGFLLLFKCLQFKINLNSPEKINNFFNKLGISQLLLQAPNLQQFLNPFLQNQLFIEIKNNMDHPLNIYYRIFNFMKKYLYQGFQIGFCWKNTIFHAEIKYPGLIKIFDRLFKQQ